MNVNGGAVQVGRRVWQDWVSANGRDGGQGIVEVSVIVEEGVDITTEAAISKLMFILGKKLNNEQTKLLLNKSLKGELSQ